MATKNTTPTFRQLISSDRTYGERSRNTTHKQALKNITLNSFKVGFDLLLQGTHTLSNIVTGYKGVEIADDVALTQLLKDNNLSKYQREVLASAVEGMIDYSSSDDEKESQAKVRAYKKTLSDAEKTSFEKAVKALITAGKTRLEAQLSLIK